MLRFFTSSALPGGAWIAVFLGGSEAEMAVKIFFAILMTTFWLGTRVGALAKGSLK